jgi:hypothetical protein
VKEETVIGLNESREVFRDFEKIGVFDNIPVRFLTIAKSAFGNIEYSPRKRQSRPFFATADTLLAKFHPS